MQRKKKPPVNLEEFLKTDRKSLTKEKFKRILDESTGVDNTKEIEDFRLNIGKFSLKTKIKNSSWVKSGVPASKAISWLFKTCFKEPEKYRYNKLLMYQGNLFTFEYKNPKLKNTKQLPWFDKYPLVLSLGPTVTKEGVRNLGINLHLLPPKVRIVILCTIFEMYKRLYRYQVFYKKTGPVAIKYQHLIKPLLKYGADFAIRMYIPQRQRQIVIFPFMEWHNAVFVPSRGYDSIKAVKLIQLWRKHIRKRGYATTPNIKWESHI